MPLTSLALDSVYSAMGQTESGESVTQDTSLALPVFWRCVALLSDLIAGCPIRTFRNPGKVEVFPALLDKGNAEMQFTQFELWNLVMVHLCLYGNAFVRKLRATGPTGPGSGMIVDLIPIHPGRVKVTVDNGDKIFQVKRVKPDGTVDNNRPPEILTTFEVMHIPGMGYDGVRGLSVIEMAKRTIGTALAGDRLAAKFYSSGTILSGIINVKAPLTSQNQADQIRARWLQKSGGTGHAAEVAVLDAETEFQPLTIPPDQLQFLESRRWETTEIARWFGIPPWLVGDVEKSTSWGTGIEQQNIGFVSYTVSGWTNRIEQRVTREIVATRKQYCEFDLDRLMRGDMSERFTAYGIAIQWGWLTRNEARAKENMVPIDGLDEPLTPLNMLAGNEETEKQDPDVVPLGPSSKPGIGKRPVNDENSDPD